MAKKRLLRSEGQTKTVLIEPSTIVTILLLIFITWIGIIVMWIWPRWTYKTKVVLTIIFALIQLFFIIDSIENLGI